MGLHKLEDPLVGGELRVLLENIAQEENPEFRFETQHQAGGGIKQLKEAGGWKKLAVVDQTYGHLEMTDVHDFVRGLSRNFAKPLQQKGDKNGK